MLRAWILVTFSHSCFSPSLERGVIMLIAMLGLGLLCLALMFAFVAGCEHL
jgi:hypothetical protein